MKIDGFIGDILSKYTKQAKSIEVDNNKRSKSEPSDTADKTSSQDRVEISSHAKALAQAVENDSEERTKRIEEVRAAINNNSYKPNIDEIAKSILKEWRGE